MAEGWPRRRGLPQTVTVVIIARRPQSPGPAAAVGGTTARFTLRAPKIRHLDARSSTGVIQ